MTHLEKMLQPDSQYVFYDDQHGFCINTDDVLMLFEPERKKGHWIEHEWAEEVEGLLVSNYECSCCHLWERKDSDFCPNCGADMRGERNEKVCRYNGNRNPE